MGVPLGNRGLVVEIVEIEGTHKGVDKLVNDRRETINGRGRIRLRYPPAATHSLVG